jgi:hypothetical protein
MDNEQPTMSFATSPTIGALAAALAKAQAEIEGASKDKLNPHFKSRYADLASVWDACRSPLTGNGLSVVQVPMASGPTVTVVTMMMHSSGEWLRGDLTMTAQQNTPQSVGSAITYARRYALAAMAGVAPEDDDGEQATRGSGSGNGHHLRPPQNTTAPPPSGQRQAGGVIGGMPLDVRTRIEAAKTAAEVRKIGEELAQGSPERKFASERYNELLKSERASQESAGAARQ